MNYFEAEDSWKSNDEWRLADKEAAWKFFFAAGKDAPQKVISAQCVKMNQYESIIFELRNQLAAAQEEIEQLKATPPDKREDLRCVISDLCRQVQERDAQLAAEQLNNKLLREHLRKLIEFELLDAGALSTDELCAEFRQAVIAYNATPTSTEALDKYVAEKVKEAKP